MLDYLISKAIRHCGSQKKLAHRMGVKPERISFLLNNARKISIEDALLIEDATNGVVTCHQLLQRLNRKIKQKLDGKVSTLKILPISERAKHSVAYEETLKKLNSKDFELVLRQKYSFSRQNFDATKYRIDDMAAEYGHFGNKQTYRDAKRVIQQGSLSLIQAMDERKLGVSTAARLTVYSAEEQQRILTLPRKEIIAIARGC